MAVEFHKMHGAGNDFVLIDARELPFDPAPEQAAAIADRHRGVGCDQILVLRPATTPPALLRYDILNADGGLAAQCGNGARCVALFIELNGEYPGTEYTVESPSGPVVMSRCEDGEYRVNMGVPDFEPDGIPLLLEPDGGIYRLDSPWGPLTFGAVSMGNPHAVVLNENLDAGDIPAIGAWMGAHEAFPGGVNAGFATVRDPGAIDLRVVERGAGETLACGSGACAAVAVLRRLGRAGERVEVFLPGGRLVIQWPGQNEALTMKGPAYYVFRGIFNE